MARRLMALFGGAVLVLAMTAGSALAAPGNDSALTPTVIGSLPFTDTVDTTTATADAGDPSACGSLSHTVWYTLNGGPSGIDHVILDTAGSGYSALMYVTVGSPGGEIWGCATSGLVFAALPSTTYYIMIGDADPFGTGGALQFSAMQGLAFTATIKAAASVNIKTGTAIVSGTYSCNQPSTVTALQLSVAQAVGRFTISGYGEANLYAACTPGTLYPWAIQVFPSNGKFAGGKATAHLLVWGDDATGATWISNLGPFPLSLRK
jgi:hypothetical protein